MRNCEKKLLLLVVMCLLFLTPCTTQAKEKVSPKRQAYINGASYLVLRFEGFSDEGYEYTLTNMDSGKRVSGEAKVKANEFKLPLKKTGLYKAGTVYRLVISDKKKYMEVYYYTGAVMENAVVKAGNDIIKANWAMSDGDPYSIYRVRLAPSDQPLLIQAKKDQASASVRSASVSTSALASGDYTVYIYGEAKVDGYSCYGYGRAKSASILKKPGQVTGISAQPKASRVTLSWNKTLGATGYEIYYRKGTTGKFKLYKACKTTSLTVPGLKGGKAYYFKLRAYSQIAGKTLYGKYSTAKKAAIPQIAEMVKGTKFTLDSSYHLILAWNKTQFATSYVVYYNKEGEAKYKRLGTTKKTSMRLDDLDDDTQYNLVVRARTKIGGKNYLSYYTSETLSLTPSKYMADNYNKLLASKVRTISYSKGKCIYTTKKYPTKVKEAYVNYKNYSSRTKYLIWVSTYTQQTTIFKGRKGHWKQIRTFTCATGRYDDRSPRGVFTLNTKEYRWKYVNTQILYISHFYKKASFHTRPLFYNGSVATPTLGKPASHGCVRLTTTDARFIYKSIPLKTTIVSF